MSYFPLNGWKLPSTQKKARTTTTRTVSAKTGRNELETLATGKIRKI